MDKSKSLLGIGAAIVVALVTYLFYGEYKVSKDQSFEDGFFEYKINNKEDEDILRGKTSGFENSTIETVDDKDIETIEKWDKDGWSNDEKEFSEYVVDCVEVPNDKDKKKVLLHCRTPKSIMVKLKSYSFLKYKGEKEKDLDKKELKDYMKNDKIKKKIVR